MKGPRRMTKCKECEARAHKKWMQENADHVREYKRNHHRAWKDKNPDAAKEVIRRRVLKSRYGLTPEDVDALIERQNGLCAIEGCGADANRIDHDHKTGKVRGLLCHSCNLWLAPLEEDQRQWREAADAYLQRSEQ